MVTARRPLAPPHLAGCYNKQGGWGGVSGRPVSDAIGPPTKTHTPRPVFLAGAEGQRRRESRSSTAKKPYYDSTSVSSLDEETIWRFFWGKKKGVRSNKRRLKESTASFASLNLHHHLFYTLNIEQNLYHIFVRVISCVRVRIFKRFGFIRSTQCLLLLLIADKTQWKERNLYRVAECGCSR